MSASSGRYWVGALVLAAASVWGVDCAFVRLDEHGWEEQVCKIEAPEVVEYGNDTTRYAIEARLRSKRSRHPVSEALRLASYGERAEAQTAIERKYAEGTFHPCWVDVGGRGIKASPTTNLQILAAWGGVLLALAHLMLLLGLRRRDRALAAASAPIECPPAWLPGHLTQPATGFTADVQHSSPSGTPYRRLALPSEGLIVRYRAQGYGSVVSFLVVASFLASGVGVAFVASSQEGWDFQLMGLILLIPSALTLFHLYQVVFAGIDLHFTEAHLSGTLRTGWKRRHFEVSRAAVQGVVQKYDTPESDSFPTWGLMVEAKSTIELLERQPRDKGQWLGQVIAAWVDKPLEVREPDDDSQR